MRGRRHWPRGLSNALRGPEGYKGPLTFGDPYNRNAFEYEDFAGRWGFDNLTPDERAEAREQAY